MGIGAYLAGAAAALAGILGAALLLRTRLVVSEHYQAVVERFGRYRRTLTPGRYRLRPFETAYAVVDMREQILDLRGTPVVTADNQTILLDTVLSFEVVDPVRAVYEVADYRMGLQRLIAYALRDYLGDLNRDEVLAGQSGMFPGLQTVIDRHATAWGITTHGVTFRPSSR